jgi:hypothetical protein
VAESETPDTSSLTREGQFEPNSGPDREFVGATGRRKPTITGVFGRRGLVGGRSLPDQCGRLA